MGYSLSSHTLGAVQNLRDGQDNADLTRWAMYLNLAYAYTNTHTSLPQNFNADGEIAATITHELGHILTLNDEQRSLVADAQNCRNVFVNEPEEKSCFLQNSYVATFLQHFYDNSIGMVSAKYGLSMPDFISLYAHTNYTEDLAESFLGYVALPSTQGLKGAYVDKLNFYNQYPEIQQIRTNIGQCRYLVKSNDENTLRNVYYYNVLPRQRCVHDNLLLDL